MFIKRLVPTIDEKNSIRPHHNSFRPNSLRNHARADGNDNYFIRNHYKKDAFDEKLPFARRIDGLIEEIDMIPNQRGGLSRSIVIRLDRTLPVHGGHNTFCIID